MSKSNIIQFSLNSEVIKYLPFDKYEKDFTFIVDDKEYKTSRFVADILSPTIRNLHHTDGSIDSFTISTTDKNSDHDFTEILSLVAFESVEVSADSADYARSLLFLLGNDDEVTNLHQKITGEVTVSNVFDVMRVLQARFCNQAGLLGSVLRSEIEFISGHFYEIDIGELKKFGNDIISEVLKSSCLKIESEDSLLDFLIEIYSGDRSASFLFDYVVFENVSDESLMHFYESFDIDDIDHEVWKMIVDRSIKSKVKPTDQKFEKRYFDKSVSSFLYEKGKEFKGIVNHLTEKTGGNIHSNGTIKVTSNNYSSSWEPWNLLDFDKDNGYSPGGNWDVYVCYDFKEKKVKITNYSINSIKGNNDGHHLKSWVVEVSDDGNKWTTIDEQKDSKKLKGKNLSATFDVEPSDYSRYVRLRNTAEPWGGNDLWFSSLEFYGYLKDESQ
ncbi:hypothetical protein M9Y10_033524 [Tritrichomonas musculus]|uniref:F5/8 type C domain-containing protein n=1 Tax=Tritrichomonas musculus TaxID=1915356 RepID=A0ABR2KFJ7_9EUKA